MSRGAIALACLVLQVAVFSRAWAFEGACTADAWEAGLMAADVRAADLLQVHSPLTVQEQPVVEVGIKVYMLCCRGYLVDLAGRASLVRACHQAAVEGLLPSLRHAVVRRHSVAESGDAPAVPISCSCLFLVSTCRPR